MGRKSKNKKKLTITLPDEDRPPPVLKRAVTPTPPEDSDVDSHSSEPVSPTGSACSSESLLSIGPPPYVKTPYVKTPKKVGASKSAVASYVASIAAYHEPYATTEQKYGDSSVSNSAAKKETAAKSKGVVATGRPVASTSKQLSLVDLTRDIPVAGPSRGSYLLADLSIEAPVAGSSKQSQAPQLSVRSPIPTPCTSKGTRGDQGSFGGPVAGSSKQCYVPTLSGPSPIPSSSKGGRKNRASVGGPVAGNSKQCQAPKLASPRPRSVSKETRRDQAPVRGPVAGSSKQTHVSKLSAPRPRSVSKEARRDQASVSGPVAGSSKQTHVPKSSIPSPTPSTFMGGRVGQASISVPVAGSSKQILDPYRSIGSPVAGSSKDSYFAGTSGGSPVSFGHSSFADFSRRSPSVASSSDFSIHSEFLGSFEEVAGSGSSEVGSINDSTNTGPTLEDLFMGEKLDSLENEDFNDMTDEILSTIPDTEGSFESLLQYDLSNFRTISSLIEKEEGKGEAEVTLKSGTDQTQNLLPASPNEPKATSGLIAFEDLDSIQAELETLRSSVVFRTNILIREQARLRQTAGATQKFVEENFDPKLFESSSKETFVSNDSTPYVESDKVGNETKEPVGAVAEPTSPGTETSDSFTPPSNDKRQPVRGRGASNRRKSGTNWSGRRSKSRDKAVPNEDPDEFEPLNLDSMSDEFWKFVEPYFITPTKQDWDKLERFLAIHFGDPSEYMDIPPLGKHYKDVGENDKKTDCCQESPKEGTSQGKAKSPTDATDSQPEPPKQGPLNDNVGPLTERLVKTLVHERVTQFRNTRARAKAAELGSAVPNEEPEESISQRKREAIIKLLGWDGSGATTNQQQKKQPMEQKIKNSLHEYKELLGDDAEDDKTDHDKKDDVDDDGMSPPKVDPNDQILTEIYRTQYQLKKIHAHNQRAIAALKAKAFGEIALSALEKQVRRIDRRILSMIKIDELSATYKVPERYRPAMAIALRERGYAVGLVQAKELELKEKKAAREEAEKAAAEKKSANSKTAKTKKV